MQLNSPQELKALLRDADLREFGERDAALESLQATRSELERNGDGIGAKLLDATTMLVRVIPALDASGVRMLEGIVVRLVGIVAGDDEPTGIGSASSTAIPLVTAGEYNRLGRSEDRVLGELLVEMGETTPETLGAVSSSLEDTGEKLGEALVRTGIVSDATVGNAIRLQRHMLETSGDEAQKAGLAEEWRLGDILVRRHIIDEERLGQALKMQRGSGMRLGETLVQSGAANWHQISEAVLIQKRERERERLDERSTDVRYGSGNGMRSISLDD